MAVQFQPKTIYDQLNTLQGGMVSNLVPLLLDKTQASFLFNATVRGGFVTDRPPVNKITDIVWPSDEIQTAVEQGLFQGSTYYQPDSGPQSLIVSVSGRLFQFTIVNTTATVREITVPGDPNPATTTQVWMWQAENYVIINDGLILPIFFDGTISRRSYGASVSYGTVTGAVPGTPPEIGGLVDLTLTAPYTGPYNVPVLFNGEYYQPVENSSGTYNVELTTVYAPTGATSAAGTQVVSEPQNLGYMSAATSIAAGTYVSTLPFVGAQASLQMFAPYLGSGSVTLMDSGGTNRTFTVWPEFSSGNTLVIRLNGTYPAMTFPIGTNVQISGSSPNVLIGSAVNSFVIPPSGSSVAVVLDTPYTGIDGATVFAGTVQYTIEAIPPAAPGATLTVINLSDAGGAYVFGPGLPIVSVPELPPGRMGAYVMAQNWQSLIDGFQYIASDVSRGPSGTPANNWRDAVLKIVDLTFKGGAFAIPTAGNPITSMTATANLDQSLGQGPLQIGTSAGMFSQVAPFDYTNPPTPPFLTQSLIGPGPLAQNSTIACNSDTLFRSVVGLGSLILARREFQTWGNTPISSEMTRVIVLDNQELLGYSSAVVFDNRFLVTVNPQASSQGVIHNGAIAMNLDPVSSLRGKAPAVYDGLWTGLDVLKYDVGIFGGRQRAFAWAFNVSLSKVELYELLPTGNYHFDNMTTPITWGFESAAMFGPDVKGESEYICLKDGQISVDDVVGPVRIQVEYRFDREGDSCWTPWHSFSICSSNASVPQHFPRLGLGEPSPTPCDSILKTTMREGYRPQVRLLVTGHCRLLRFDLMAVTQPIPRFARPICDDECPPT